MLALAAQPASPLPAPPAKRLALSGQLAVLTGVVLVILCLGILMLRTLGRRATAGNARTTAKGKGKPVNPWVESGRRLMEEGDARGEHRARGGSDPT
ncbi:MAG: hypothetical protein ACKVS8_13800 [Phycisphaerales bacterium]